MNNNIKDKILNYAISNNLIPANLTIEFSKTLSDVIVNYKIEFMIDTYNKFIVKNVELYVGDELVTYNEIPNLFYRNLYNVLRSTLGCKKQVALSYTNYFNSFYTNCVKEQKELLNDIRNNKTLCLIQ